MFKAKIKQKRIKFLKLYLYKVLFFSIIIGCVLGSNNTDSAFLSIDTLLQKTTQLSNFDNINDGEKTIQRDIFEKTLSDINTAGSTSIQQTLQTITSQIKKNRTYTCNISDSDINTILGQSPGLLLDFYQYYTIPSSTTVIESSNNEENDIKNSCTRLLRCYGVIKKDNEVEDIRVLENCKQIVKNIYYVNSNIYKTNNNISSLNKNDNIYMDGIKDNGLFDLMIDIENTKNILFSKNDGPSLPQMIYYSLPNINTSANNINSIQNNIPGGISGIGGGNNSTSTGSTNNNTNNSGTNNGIKNNNIISNINNFISEIQNNNSKDGTLITNQTNNNTIQSAICLPEDNPTNVIQEESATGNNTDEEDQDNIINNFNMIQEQLINYTSGYLFSTPTTVGGSNNGYNNNIIQTDGALPSTTQQCQNSCSNTEGTEKLICEGKCCLQSCEQVSNASDKAICLSQCLCGETSIANDILRIKICRVPAQPARVLAGKKISSIQEAIDEINEIFNKLKQNGLLIKRTKKKEMLDSSYSNIKFNEILAFDIFMAVKPIYDKLQINQAKEDSKNQNKSSELIKGFEEKPLQGADRNKYIMLTKKTGVSQIQECASKGEKYNGDGDNCTTSVGQKENLILESLSKGYTKSLINDTFLTFFTEHNKLRDEISKKIGELTTITTALRTKAENAK